MDTQASDQFWMTLQSRGEENMAKMENDKFNHMIFDTAANIKQAASNENNHNLTPRILPKLQFENIIPQTTDRPADNNIYVSPATPQVQNQFLLQEKIRQKYIEELNKQAESSTSIQIHNPGSSGLQVVQGAVPLDESEQMFSVGSSLVIGGESGTTTASPNMVPGHSITVQIPSSSITTGSTITVQPQGVDPRSSISIQPEVGVYPSGDDPNILHRYRKIIFNKSTSNFFL